MLIIIILSVFWIFDINNVLVQFLIIKTFFFLFQITSLLVVPIEIDTVFESGMYSAAISISGKRFTEMSQIRHASFDQR